MILEVCGSREHFERFNREVVGPVMADLAPGPPPEPGQGIDEFDVRGLVVPSAGIHS